MKTAPGWQCLVGLCILSLVMVLSACQAVAAPVREGGRVVAQKISLPVAAAVVHRPPHFTDRNTLAALPEGVVVLAEVPAQAKDMAARMAIAFARDRCELAAAKQIHILSSGPMLDGPDRVQVHSLTREGAALKLEVIYTNVRRQGAQLRRNITWRPVVQVPIELPAGSYTVEATWRALETLPNGKPLEGKPLVYTRTFKLGDAANPEK